MLYIAGLILYRLLCALASDKQPCAGNEHALGKWVYNEGITRKDFVCCGFDYNDFQSLPTLSPYCGWSKQFNGEHVKRGGFKEGGVLDVYMQVCSTKCM